MMQPAGAGVAKHAPIPYLAFPPKERLLLRPSSLESLLGRTSKHPEAMDVKRWCCLSSGPTRHIRRERPKRGHDLHGHPVGLRSTLTNEEWRINAQLRLGLPLVSRCNLPLAPCPHGCRHPQTKEPVKVRYGYHLVTTAARQTRQEVGKDVEATIIHHFSTYTSITATKGKPFRDEKKADILLSGITTIDNLYLDVTSTKPMGVTNQEFINRAALGHQPGPGEHDSRNDVLTSVMRAEALKHRKYDAICAATGSHVSPFALETTGGHGASTATVYFLFAKQLRDSGLPADVLVGKLKKDISLALRRGTIPQETTHALDAAQRAVKDELVLNEAGWVR